MKWWNGSNSWLSLETRGAATLVAKYRGQRVGEGAMGALGLHGTDGCPHGGVGGQVGIGMWCPTVGTRLCTTPLRPEPGGYTVPTEGVLTVRNDGVPLQIATDGAHHILRDVLGDVVPTEDPVLRVSTGHGDYVGVSGFVLIKNK